MEISYVQSPSYAFFMLICFSVFKDSTASACMILFINSFDKESSLCERDINENAKNTFEDALGVCRYCEASGALAWKNFCYGDSHKWICWSRNDLWSRDCIMKFVCIQVFQPEGNQTKSFALARASFVLCRVYYWHAEKNFAKEKSNWIRQKTFSVSFGEQFKHVARLVGTV